ncbi:MAG: PAS domain-containing protein, partial [Nitrospinae bacterium]|nr:PAS domain-containing protein [Nitrospinota bacterium]
LVAIVPSAFLFWIASGFIYSTVNNWFRFDFEKSMVQSTAIGQKYFETVKKRAQLFSSNIAEKVEETVKSGGGDVMVKKLLEGAIKEFGLVSVNIFNSTFQEIYGANEQSSSRVPIKQHLIEELFTHVIEGKQEGTVIQFGNSDIVYGMTQVKLDKDVGVILARFRITPSISNLTFDLNQSINNFNQLKHYQDPLKFSYVATFLLIFLFIILSAIWFAMYISRGITGTIENVLEGTKRIAVGDLDIKVEHGSDSEINVVVDSFNDMAENVRNFRKKSEDANRELELKVQYIETVLNNVKAGVISFDYHGRLQTINQSAKRILHLSESINYLGKHYKNLMNKDYFTEIKSLLKDLLASNEISLGKEIDIIVDGKRLHLLLQFSFILDLSGKTIGILCVFEDITEFLTNKEIAAWKDVAQSIAHEIKNPLMPIQLNTERLRKKFVQDREGFDKVFLDSSKIIVDETDRLKRMVNEFREFARMAPINRKNKDIIETIMEVIKLYDEAHSEILFKLNVEESTLVCNYDPDQIKRVFINLIKNSIEAIKEKGRIEIHLVKRNNGKNIEIIFQDNGEGIDKNIENNLFKPYVTTKVKGTGLGLAIVQRIIHEHGGTINLMKNDKGTHFKINLPVE